MIVKVQNVLSCCPTLLKNHLNKIPLDRTTKIAIGCLIGSLIAVCAICKLIGRLRKIEPDEKSVWTNRALAILGNPHAHINLGMQCESVWMKFLVERKMIFSFAEYLNNHGNEQEAIKYFTFAADQGCEKAAAFLGMHYLVKEKHKKAEKYLVMAVELGNLDSCYALIGFYKFQKRDNDKFKFAKLAADNDLKDLEERSLARYCVGKAYEKGKGVAKSEEQANLYYESAADIGHKPSMDKLGWTINKPDLS